MAIQDYFVNVSYYDDDAIFDKGDDENLFQSFEAQASYDLYAVRLALIRPSEDDPGDITVSIQGISNDEPDDNILASKTISGTKLFVSSGSEEELHWVVFNFDTPVSITASTSYAIVVNCEGDGYDNNYAMFQCSRFSYVPPATRKFGYKNIHGNWAVFNNGISFFETHDEPIEEEEEDKTKLVRLIDFSYSDEISYVVELGDKYARFFYDDQYIGAIETPYAKKHLYELQYKQIGDVMWIVHRNYAQRKLSRRSETTFSLDVVIYEKGPFLTRNDLINPDAITPARMKFDGKTLECTGSVFKTSHVGALFALWHPKKDRYVELSGQGTTMPVYAKGKITLLTRGTWTGKLLWQRKDKTSDWTDFRTYQSSQDAHRNIQETYNEEDDGVMFRLTGENLSASFRGELSVEESMQKGIVRVVDYQDENSMVAVPITPVASGEPTRKWAEGAWSDYRGYPTSLTFFEDRCIFAGQRTIPQQILEDEDFEE